MMFVATSSIMENKIHVAPRSKIKEEPIESSEQTPINVDDSQPPQQSELEVTVLGQDAETEQSDDTPSGCCCGLFPNNCATLAVLMLVFAGALGIPVLYFLPTFACEENPEYDFQTSCEDHYNRMSIVIPLVSFTFLYLFYLLNSFHCSTFQFLKNGVYDQQQLAEYMEKMHSSAPSIKWHARSWHMASRQVRTQNGTTTQTYQVTTHTAEKEFEFESWSDISADCSSILDRKMARIEYKFKIQFESELKEAHDQSMEKWANDHKKDKCNSCNEIREIPDMKTHVLSAQVVPFWLNMKCYVLATILGFGPLFRWKFCKAIPCEKYTFIKKIS